MRIERMRAVRIRLDDTGDLFDDPGADSDRFISGIEEIYRAIKSHTRVFVLSGSYQITIELPHEKMTDHLADELGAKIKRYCQFHIDQSQQDMLTLRHQGLDSVRVGVLVLIPCLILGGFANWLSQTDIHNVLKAVFEVISAIFVLSAGWVALWMPAELFLYDPWPYQLDRRVYRLIAEAELVISERGEQTATDHAPDGEGDAPALRTEGQTASA